MAAQQSRPARRDLTAKQGHLPMAFSHLLILALLGINVAGEKGKKHSSSPS